MPALLIQVLLFSSFVALGVSHIARYLLPVAFAKLLEGCSRSIACFVTSHALHMSVLYVNPKVLLHCVVMSIQCFLLFPHGKKPNSWFWVWRDSVVTQWYEWAIREVSSIHLYISRAAGYWPKQAQICFPGKVILSPSLWFIFLLPSTVCALFFLLWARNVGRFGQASFILRLIFVNLLWCRYLHLFTLED